MTNETETNKFNCKLKMNNISSQAKYTWSSFFTIVKGSYTTHTSKQYYAILDIYKPTENWSRKKNKKILKEKKERLSEERDILKGENNN